MKSFSTRCLLYFPPNRFEEPAWLNEDNLKAQAHYVDQSRRIRETSRRAIAYSPLLDNQNWLFGLLFDRANFDAQVHELCSPATARTMVRASPQSTRKSYILGLATTMYSAVLQIVQNVTGISQLQIRCRHTTGPRCNCRIRRRANSPEYLSVVHRRDIPIEPLLIYSAGLQFERIHVHKH